MIAVYIILGGIIGGVIAAALTKEKLRKPIIILLLITLPLTTFIYKPRIFRYPVGIIAGTIVEVVTLIPLLGTFISLVPYACSCKEKSNKMTAECWGVIGGVFTPVLDLPVMFIDYLDGSLSDGDIYNKLFQFTRCTQRPVKDTVSYFWNL